MSLPKPVLSNSDLVMCWDGSWESARNSWRQDPIKSAVLRAVLSCESILFNTQFGSDMAVALSQNFVCLPSFIGSGIELLKGFQDSCRMKDLLFTLYADGVYRAIYD